jgi:hypothetical protein
MDFDKNVNKLNMLTKMHLCMAYFTLYFFSVR